MQSYVARRFGELRDPITGEPVCIPLMDDLTISSFTLEEHIRHVNQVLDTAGEDRFEFKLTKGQFNQTEVILWGCICDKRGRRPQPKQIKQLDEWPEPTTESDVASFLAFVNYLRKWMNPDWLRHEATLSPFRKNGVDFKALWNGAQGEKYKQAFREIRRMLA